MVDVEVVVTTVLVSVAASVLSISVADVTTALSPGAAKALSGSTTAAGKYSVLLLSRGRAYSVRFSGGSGAACIRVVAAVVEPAVVARVVPTVTTTVANCSTGDAEVKSCNKSQF